MKKLLKKYVICTYGVFYGFLILIGLTMLVLKLQTLSQILKVISAWTPALVFITMFHKIYPNEHFRNYMRGLFREKLRISTAVYAVLLQVLIFLAGILLTNLFENSVKTQIDCSFTSLIIGFGDNIIRGPLGEELGWRGFALNELQNKYSLLKSAVIIGVIWGFWHTPLWFLSGYEGKQLIQYIICFMVGSISLSVLITVFYNLNHNLMIPIMMHQLFNYLLAIKSGNQLYVLTINALLYFLTAFIVISCAGIQNHQKECTVIPPKPYQL